MSAAVLRPEQQEFQEYARRRLAENGPPPPSERLPITPLEVVTVGQCDSLHAWQPKCDDVGLLGADYPAEFRGGGNEGNGNDRVGPIGGAGAHKLLRA